MYYYSDKRQSVMSAKKMARVLDPSSDKLELHKVTIKSYSVILYIICVHIFNAYY